jgi:hypothetical protein
VFGLAFADAWRKYSIITGKRCPDIPVTERPNSRSRSATSRGGEFEMTTSQSSREYSPEILAAIQQAFDGVWMALYASVDNDIRHKELSIKLSRTLVEMAAYGITDPEDLRGNALEIMALTPR